MQLPVRLLVLPEAMRSAACALLALVYIAAWQPGGLTPALAAAVVARAAVIAAVGPFFVALCHNRAFRRRHLPASLDVCPRALAPAVGAVARAAERVAADLLPEPAIDAAALSAVFAAVLVSANCFGGIGRGIMDACLRLSTAVVVALLASLAYKRQAGTTTALALLQRRLGRYGGASDSGGRSAAGSLALPEDEDAQGSGAAAAALATKLADALDERDAVRVALEALHALFPGARACAVAAVTPEDGHVTFIEAAAAVAGERAALLRALPRVVPPSRDAPRGSAAACVCAPAGIAIASSADWPLGAAAFPDWAAVAAAAASPDAAPQQFITARLPAAGGAAAAAVGYAVLTFARRDAFRSDDAGAHERLLRFCEAAGAAVGARRAADAYAAQAVQLNRATRLARDVFPEHLLEAALWSRRSGDGGATPRRTPSLTHIAAAAAAAADGADGGADAAAVAAAAAAAAAEVRHDAAAAAAAAASPDLLFDRYDEVTVIFAGTTVLRKHRMLTVRSTHTRPHSQRAPSQTWWGSQSCAPTWRPRRRCHCSMRCGSASTRSAPATRYTRWRQVRAGAGGMGGALVGCHAPCDLVARVDAPRVACARCRAHMRRTIALRSWRQLCVSRAAAARAMRSSRMHPFCSVSRMAFLLSLLAPPPIAAPQTWRCLACCPRARTTRAPRCASRWTCTPPRRVWR
jgi:hypothetical protein